MVSNEFRHLPEYRGVIGTPRGVNGPHGPKVEHRRGGQGRPRAPPPLVRIGQGGGGAPLSFLSSLRSSPLLLQLGKEGVLLPVGVGLLLARPSWPAAPSPLAPLYTGAGGTLEHTS